MKSHAVLVLLLASLATAFRVAPPPRIRRASVPSDGFKREAEIKHGRVAMTSAVALAALAASGFEHPATVLSQCPVEQQLLFFSSIGVAEAATYLPRLGPAFSLKEGVVPGVFGSVGPIASNTNVEDAVGRAAMCGVAAFLAKDVFL